MMKKIYHINGPVNINNSIYVEREIDTIVLNRLTNNCGQTTVNAPRMTGKTSLIRSTIKKIEESHVDYKIALIDFRLSRDEDTAQKFFRWIIDKLIYELKLEPEKILDWYDNQSKLNISPSTLFHRFIRDDLRNCENEKLILIFDEIEAFQQLGAFTDEFFTVMEMLSDQAEDLKISILLAGIVPISSLLKNTPHSSIKHNKVFRIPDFEPTEQAISDFSKGLTMEENAARNITKEVFKYTSGHAYLTSYILNDIYQEEISDTAKVSRIVGKIINDWHKQNDDSLDHFKSPKEFIVADRINAYEALTTYEKILNEDHDNRFELKALNLLLTAGLIKKIDERYKCRSKIYAKVFNKAWIKRTRLEVDESINATIYHHVEQNSIPKICFINYGGTIGMIESGNKMIAPNDENEFFRAYPDIRNFADVKYFQPRVKDGVNVFPEDWKAIASMVYEKRNENYDAIVIAHGTDTLQYTASAVAFALGKNLSFPVIFVGAQAPHNAYHADSNINLKRAIRLAMEDLPEVVILFNDKVFRAVRAQKVSDYDFEGFTSPTLPTLATIRESVEIDNNVIRSDSKIIDFKNEFEERVIQITQYPGLNPDYFYHILDDLDVKGILIESLGIGNLPTQDEYSLTTFIKKAKKYEIPVIITSKYKITTKFIEKYLPAMIPLKLGAIHAKNMVSSAALTKLMWLLPQIERDIENGDLLRSRKFAELQKMMETSYIGEVDIK